MMATVPSASKRMPPISLLGGAVTSRKLPTPSPRTFPRLRLSRLRRGWPLLTVPPHRAVGPPRKPPPARLLPPGALIGGSSRLLLLRRRPSPPPIPPPAAALP